jgi:Zn-dependent peptidase ImmA (M78 family)
MPLKRGFKAQAERVALKARSDMELQPHHALLAKDYAAFLGIKFIPVSHAVKDKDHLAVLNRKDGWSAFSIMVGPARYIVNNETHSDGRQETDIMHEISHHLCGHPPSHAVPLREGASGQCRSFFKDIEDEADWMAGCLKVPKDGLVWAIRNGMSNDDMVRHFSSNLKMVTFRRSMTGVDKMLGAPRSSRAA